MKHCCETDSTPNKDAEVQLPNEHQHHHHDAEHKSAWLAQLNLLLALFLLVAQLVLNYGFDVDLPKPIAFAINALAYYLAGAQVVLMAFRKIRRGDFFNEFVLMTIATLGAFYIGEYTEGLAVMVFYSIGEWFQDAAVDKAKRSIKSLLDSRPEQVSVLKDGVYEAVSASSVLVKAIVQLKPGEKLALDGLLLSDRASFNTAALTGESKPDTKYKGDPLLAGMVNLDRVIEMQVTSLFKDSKLSKMLSLVQDAAAKKSQTQLFISSFAKIYTPIVFFLALALVLVPLLFVADYRFNDWLYRAMVFLVISCPCALVVSIPLGYFGGIGLASKNGMLFKGSNYLDVMAKVDTVVMDKTGTLTQGVFRVQEIHAETLSEADFLQYMVSVEQHSTHPIAKAISNHAGGLPRLNLSEVKEIAGHGISAQFQDKSLLVGNVKLLRKYQIAYPDTLELEANTLVVLAVNGVYAGYLTIADELKPEAAATIKALKAMKIDVHMLSGDKQAVVDAVAKQLAVPNALGDLLPEDKLKAVEELIAHGKTLSFVGDGINDAPVLALAHAGIAMGGLGSDAAIETADIVIQNDQISKVVAAIQCGKLTRKIVWQNISLAMTVKLLVLSFGAFGVANLWEAVIADVGVALLAILNAYRIQGIKLRGLN